MIKPAKAGFFMSGVRHVNVMATLIHAWRGSTELHNAPNKNPAFRRGFCIQ